ncbi:hypothetical protein ASH02_08420 [Nocardioides sp. Soil796]|nr:hypothetical protein ASH02_08420 [Nocardioides sp. Soil796]
MPLRILICLVILLAASGCSHDESDGQEVRTPVLEQPRDPLPKTIDCNALTADVADVVTGTEMRKATGPDGTPSVGCSWTPDLDPGDDGIGQPAVFIGVASGLGPLTDDRFAELDIPAGTAGASHQPLADHAPWDTTLRWETTAPFYGGLGYGYEVGDRLLHCSLRSSASSARALEELLDGLDTDFRAFCDQVLAAVASD